MLYCKEYGMVFTSHKYSYMQETFLAVWGGGLCKGKSKGSMAFHNVCKNSEYVIKYIHYHYLLVLCDCKVFIINSVMSS